MWIRDRLPAFLLVPLLAACGGDPPPVVLVHATDPHLLEGGRRAHEQTSNLLAFTQMMDWVAEGHAGDPTPPDLVITGDFGLEWADPRLSPGPGALPGTGTLAEQRLQALASTVASEIQGSNFQNVYFVPGNNDVLLEDADPRQWSGIDAFVRAVQSRLRGKTFVDLTACYRRETFRASDCYARLAGNHVLVGFPTISFKNELSTADYDRFVRGALMDSTLSREEGLRRWAERQDAIHRGLLARLGDVLSEATAGGWRALLVTHIPELDDPYYKTQPKDSVYLRLRRVQDPRPDAWNVSDTTFAQWAELVASPRIAGVLAGHFHSADTSKYYQPYDWSRSRGHASASKTFVAPPLAVKNQPAGAPRARGFAVVTLADPVRRRLYWYEERATTLAGSFQPGRNDAPPGSPPAAREERGIADAGTDAETGRRLAYSLSFVLALLTAYAAFIGWRTDAGPYRWNPAPTWALIQRMAKWWNAREERTRKRILNSVRGLLPVSGWGTAALIMESIWDMGSTFWLYTILWFAAGMIGAYLLRFKVLPRLQQSTPIPSNVTVPGEAPLLDAASPQPVFLDLTLQGPNDVPASGGARERQREDV